MPYILCENERCRICKDKVCQMDNATCKDRKVLEVSFVEEKSRSIYEKVSK